MLVANIISSGFPKITTGETEANIIFSREDAMHIHPHDDDPLVITVQHDIWDIMRVMIDPGRSTDILFWDAFWKLQLNLDDV